MGKAQSKRSVDITTETTTRDVDEGAIGKMGKIEDIDQINPTLKDGGGDTDLTVSNSESSKWIETQENTFFTKRLLIFTHNTVNINSCY